MAEQQEGAVEPKRGALEAKSSKEGLLDFKGGT